MTNQIILIAFTLLLIVANLICFKRKIYLYIFIPCMLFLPDYYGIELSQSLPIISVKRIMFIVFYLFCFINKRIKISEISIFIKKLFKNNITFIFLSLYFICRYITNFYYITVYSQPIKTIFEITFEQLFLIIALLFLCPSKKEIVKTMEITTYAATFLFICGIYESLSYSRLFDALYTVNREMLNIHEIRLGLMRATTSLGMPGFYGNMCILMLPIILFLFNYSKKFRYILAISLDFIAVLHSGCRANTLFFIFIIFVYFLFSFLSKENIKHIITYGVMTIVISSFILLTLSFINPFAKYYYSRSIKSALNEVGFNYDLAEGIPNNVPQFGVNDGTGVESRLYQLSGIKYTFKINPVFGLGSGVQNRGQISYYYKTKWIKSYTFDSGYVEIICSEGLIGLLAILFLIAFLFVCGKKYLANKPNNYIIMVLIISYLVCILSTANMFSFLFYYVIIAAFLSDTLVLFSVDKMY